VPERDECVTNVIRVMIKFNQAVVIRPSYLGLILHVPCDQRNDMKLNAVLNFTENLEQRVIHKITK
jgi:hypothetical protein